MKWLLDTHALLLLITDDERLSGRARRIFLDPENRLFFSAAGMWEISIKISLGKLSLKQGWLNVIRNEMEINSIYWLPVEMDHCAEVSNLPFHNRDPFDRMLIAQARVENMNLLSRDVHLSQYDVTCVW